MYKVGLVAVLSTLVGGVASADSEEPVWFSHQTSVSNTKGARTTLSHPRLNGNKDAILIAAQVLGRNNPHAVGVQFAAERWHVINLDGADLPLGGQFDVLVFGPRSPRAFVHRADAENTKGAHSLIDYGPGRRKDSVLFVTPLAGESAGAGASAEDVAVRWARGGWSISTLNGEPLAPGRAFFVVALGTGGFWGGRAVIHRATSVTLTNDAGRHVTNTHETRREAMAFVTQRMGATAPTNPHSVGAWFDGERWTVFNQNKEPVAENVAFNVLTLPNAQHRLRAQSDGKQDTLPRSERGPVASIEPADTTRRGPLCWRARSERSPKTEPTECPGMESGGNRCFERCRAGYESNGVWCRQRCPAGFEDTGDGCKKPAPTARGAGFTASLSDGMNDRGMLRRCEAKHGRGGCEKIGSIMYPKCPPGFASSGRRCLSGCPAGMRDEGATCQKQQYGRGEGGRMRCAPDLVRDGYHCRERCAAGLEGRGDACFSRCPNSHPIDCGAACTRSVHACAAGMTNDAEDAVSKVARVTDSSLARLTGASQREPKVRAAGIAGLLTQRAKAMGRTLPDAALESAGATLEAAQRRGDLGWATLTTAQLAALVEAYDAPMCESE